MVTRKKDRRKQRHPDHDTLVIRHTRGAERRRQDRRATKRIEIALWAEQARGKEWVVRHVADLSPLGMRLDHGLPYPVGTRATLKFSLPNDPHRFEIEAEVLANQWNDKRPCSNVRFMDMNRSDARRLLAYIHQSNP